MEWTPRIPYGPLARLSTPETMDSVAAAIYARRKFFGLSDVTRKKGKSKGNSAISPTALEAVKRIDALFAIKREINGSTADGLR